MAKLLLEPVPSRHAEGERNSERPGLERALDLARDAPGVAVVEFVSTLKHAQERIEDRFARWKRVEGLQPTFVGQASQNLRAAVAEGGQRGREQAELLIGQAF